MHPLEAVEKKPPSSVERRIRSRFFLKSGTGDGKGSDETLADRF